MATKRVVITGANGQLGQALQRTCPEWAEVIPLHRTDCDVTDPDAVAAQILPLQPAIILHCAAWTNVDACERDPLQAYRINALGVQHVAAIAQRVGAHLIMISTNYVFDGESAEPYHEFASPHPINVYGWSKLMGEEAARALCPHHTIVRTAMLYDRTSRNFVTTVLRLAREQSVLRMVYDQFGNPTFTDDLAHALWTLASKGVYGTYHLVNSGQASWYDWARAVVQIAELPVSVEPIPASAYQRAARPPRNGVLTSLAAPALGITLPNWEDALRRCLRGES